MAVCRVWHGLAVARCAVFVGAITAFTFYEYCRTLAHLNVPNGHIDQHITRTHLAHHCQDYDLAFHISLGMGWTCRLFATAHVKQAARARFDRKAMLSLGMDPEDLRLVTARNAYGLTRDQVTAARVLNCGWSHVRLDIMSARMPAARCISLSSKNSGVTPKRMISGARKSPMTPWAINACMMA